MTQITITLPEAAQAYIDEQLANGTYATLDELVRWFPGKTLPSPLRLRSGQA